MVSPRVPATAGAPPSGCPAHTAASGAAFTRAARGADAQTQHAATASGAAVAGAGGAGVSHESNASGGAASSRGGCPVSHEGGGTAVRAFAEAAGSSAPVVAGGAAAGSADDSGRLNPNNIMPEERQQPLPDQEMPLSKHRVQSSIPKAEFTPGHQPKDQGNWVYPSQQMFYNAMRRKGWGAKEQDMPAVVAIHNAVNERTWREVLKWEALHQAYVVIIMHAVSWHAGYGRQCRG